MVGKWSVGMIFQVWCASSYKVSVVLGDGICGSEGRFQEVTGSLLYLAINTRPDIAYAVNVLCRFNAKPTFSACRAAVKATLEYGIQYSGHRFSPEGYADSGGETWILVDQLLDMYLD